MSLNRPKTEGNAFENSREIKTSIVTDFLAWLDQQQGRQYELHAQHINPVFVKMLRTIGFDKAYVRGEGWRSLYSRTGALP